MTVVKAPGLALEDSEAPGLLLVERPGNKPLTSSHDNVTAPRTRTRGEQILIPNVTDSGITQRFNDNILTFM